MQWDGIILEIYYISGSLPYIYACYDNNGLLTKQLIYQETTSLPINSYSRKEIFMNSENFIGFETKDSSFGSPSVYGHIIIHAARKDANNKLHKIGTFGILASGSVFTQLRNEIFFNVPIQCPGFVVRQDYFNGTNYYGFPSAVIGSTNVIQTVCNLVTPAGSSFLDVTFYLHNAGGDPLAVYNTQLSISPSTTYSLYISSSSNLNHVTPNYIFISDPIFKELLNTSFRVVISPDVGTVTPTNAYYSFDKFFPISSNY